MKAIPKGGTIGKTVHFAREISQVRVPLYAANASFFIVIAVFPALLLLVGVLQYTPFEVERLGELLEGLLPEPFLERAEELILMTYDNMTGATLGLSAFTALWSASRGMFGILTGLNAIYGVHEDRGYVYTRLISVVYTFALLVALVLTLALHVFGSSLLALLETSTAPFVRFLADVMDTRFLLLVLVQTAVFTAMFVALPNRRNRLRDSLPGAVLASVGWLVFSDLFSIYVEKYAGLTNVFGSVYALSLSMLWLYFCVSIVFYGGVFNVCLGRIRENRENMEKM